MRIRKLELQGFKSFVDRQVFHFGDGIAGVVGPNGCGKSNVLDAVKWCLGEQSARSLRGKGMQDVIFAGSATRPPVGMAEVTITFAAGDEPFPGRWARYSELSVGRRLFRDGRSEYRINRERVRLRDVTDLFLDTGIGNRFYAFIEQGRVDELVRARPHERRGLLEEAAGISRYKSRRDEALARLEQVDANLERARDIHDELTRRLARLARQVVRAVRYRRLRARARQAEVFLALVRYRELVAERRALSGRVAAARREEEEAHRRLEAAEKALAGLRERVTVEEEVLGTLRDRFGELEAERRERESARHYLGRQREDLQARRRHALEAVAAAEAERSSAGSRLEALRAALAEAEARRGELASACGELADRESAARSRRDTLLAEAEALRGEVAAAMSARASARARAERHGGRVEEARRAHEDLRGRRARSEEGLGTLRAAVGVAEEARRAAEEAVAGGREALAAASGREAEARAVEEAAERRRRAAESELTARSRKVAELEERLQAVERMMARHEGVEKGVRRLLGRHPSLATLAEGLDVPEPLEEPLARALGDRLEHVVVPEADLAALVQEVGRREHVGFLVPGEVERVEGVAAEVAGEPAAVAALHRLLPRARACARLEEALDAAGSGWTCLVGARTVVRPGGIVEVGATGGGAGRALLERRRTRQRLAEALAAALREREAAAGTLREAEAAVVAARAAREDVRQEVRAAREGLDALLLAAERARLRVGAAEREVEVRLRELAAVRRAAEQAEERIRSFHEAARAARREAEAAEERLRAADERLAGVRADLVAAEEVLAGLAGELADRRSRLAVAVERVTGASRELRSVEGAVARAERERSVRVREAAELEKRLEEVARDLAAHAEALQALGERQAELRARIDASRARLATDRGEVERRSSAVAALRAGREAAAGQRAELERRHADAERELGALRERVEEAHGVRLAALLDRLEVRGALTLAAGEGLELPEGLEAPDLPEVGDLRVAVATLGDAARVRAEVEALEAARRALRGLGDVNLAALQEYRELSEEVARAAAQRADLEEAATAIRRTVADLNRTCRERLRRTFDAVDRHFRELYPRLVGGGQARLELTDDEDVLEAGIVILAQPPGKRLRSLELMSGGEKAMTAIALLFALFMVKPSPFCLLDEVDAPLDEGNGARFNEMLREMSRRSQFIVITHNRKTMEVVDTLYGVTMPQPGVSRLVSVEMR